MRLLIAGQGRLPPMQRLENALRGQLFGKAVDVVVVPQQTVGFATD